MISYLAGAEGGGMSAAPVEADGPVCTMRPGDPVLKNVKHANKQLGYCDRNKRI
jgi:hypothetical protein